MKIKGIPKLLISRLCSRKKKKSTFKMKGISAGFYFHEIIVLMKKAKNKTLTKITTYTVKCTVKGNLN